MEKEKLISSDTLRQIGLKLPVSLLLAAPLLGMLITSNKVLAEVELGDPVELYKTHPWSMAFFRWCLIGGIIFAFTPFKRLCSLAAGLAVGSLVFYALDLYHQLEELSKMGLSSKPLTEMVTLSSAGKWMIGWTAATAATQIVLGLIFPCLRFCAWKKPRN